MIGYHIINYKIVFITFFTLQFIFPILQTSTNKHYNILNLALQKFRTIIIYYTFTIPQNYLQHLQCTFGHRLYSFF